MEELKQNRLLKILSLLDGATTTGEAAAAMDRAARLLDGEGMTIEEFREKFGEGADEEPERVELDVRAGKIYMPGKRIELWKHCGLNTVAEVCDLKILYQGEYVFSEGKFYTPYVIVGNDESIVAAGRLLDQLMMVTFPACKRTFQATGDYRDAPAKLKRRMTKDYATGFWTTLYKRAHDERKAREAARKERLIGHDQTTALVRARDVIHQRREEMIEIEAKRATAGMNLRSSGGFRTGVHSAGAYEQGQSAARGVTLGANRQRGIGYGG